LLCSWSCDRVMYLNGRNDCSPSIDVFITMHGPIPLWMWSSINCWAGGSIVLKISLPHVSILSFYFSIELTVYQLVVQPMRYIRNPDMRLVSSICFFWANWHASLVTPTSKLIGFGGIRNEHFGSSGTKCPNCYYSWYEGLVTDSFGVCPIRLHGLLMRHHIQVKITSSS
jgi:hypothetical protein